MDRKSIPKEYYELLKKNKEQFDQITSDEIEEPGKSRGGRSNEQYVIGTLKSDLIKKCTSFTDDDEEFIQVILEKYNEGVIPKNITKRIKQKIEKLFDMSMKLYSFQTNDIIFTLRWLPLLSL